MHNNIETNIKNPFASRIYEGHIPLEEFAFYFINLVCTFRNVFTFYLNHRLHFTVCVFIFYYYYNI